jgi:hypothetical protein
MTNFPRDHPHACLVAGLLIISIYANLFPPPEGAVSAGIHSASRFPHPRLEQSGQSGPDDYGLSFYSPVS